MINDFLFRLVNDAKAASGRIPKPGGAVTPYTGARALVQDALLAGSNTRDEFRAAVALTLMLRHSMLASYETAQDPRLTYDDADLYYELLGSADTVTAPTGVTATYAATDSTPSEETWAATVVTSTQLSVLSSMGTELAAAAFSASAAVTVPLRIGSITLSVIGIPPIGSQIVVARRAKYRYSLSAARKRLDLIGDNALFSVIPADLQSLLRDGFVAKTTTRLLAAAIGVAYGE